MTHPGDLIAVEAELRDALAPGIQLLRPIGRGAMGAVFLGRDPALKRNVVIKVLAPELANDPVARQRFAREAETAAAVSHPNVVEIFHVGQLPVSGAGYFVMRHVDGPTLGEASPLGTPLPQARCRRIVGEIASALAAAHARALVHRDIKPSNVMLDGVAERVVVLDFGISAAVAVEYEPGDERLTRQGTSLGTPAYMSPEQAAGDDASDRSDVYSLGVLAFELLTGRAPFQATSPIALAAAHIKDTPPPVASLRPDVDPLFGSLVDRMLAKVPSARPEAAAIARALLPAAHLIEWPPPGLERMRGVGAVGLNFLVAAALIVSFNLLVASPGNDLGRFLFDAMTALVGVAAIGVCGVALGIAIRQARHACREGYPLTVVLDVLFDRDPLTEALINGSGIYASLPPGTGARWLWRRRWAAASRCAGATLTMLLVALWSLGLLGLADRDSGESVTMVGFFVVVAPLAIGILVAAALRRPERRARPRGAGETLAGRKLAPIPNYLIESWLATSSSGAIERSRRSAAKLFVAEWSITIVVLGVTLSLLASMIARTIESIGGASGAPTRYQMARLAISIGEARTRPSIDSAIAAHAVPAKSSVDTTSLNVIIASNDRAGVDPAVVWRAFSVLPGPLPVALRSVLDTAVHPEWVDAFGRVVVGNAPTMWYAPRADLRSVAREPDARIGDYLVRLATRQAGAAALALARGDKSTAVRRAREIVGMGRLLQRDPLRAAYLRGLGIAGTGARVLREIGIATGDATLTREGLAIDGVIAERRDMDADVTRRTLERFGSRPDGTLLLALAGDKRMLPVDRWSAAAAIARGACFNAAELRAGVSPQRATALAEAARRLSDIARSDEWIQLQRAFLAGLESPSAIQQGMDIDIPAVFGIVRPFVRTARCSAW